MVRIALKDRGWSIVDPDGNWRIVLEKVKAWVGGGQPSSAGRKMAGAGVVQISISRQKAQFQTEKPARKVVRGIDQSPEG